MYGCMHVCVCMLWHIVLYVCKYTHVCTMRMSALAVSQPSFFLHLIANWRMQVHTHCYPRPHARLIPIGDFDGPIYLAPHICSVKYKKWMALSAKMILILSNQHKHQHSPSQARLRVCHHQPYQHVLGPRRSLSVSTERPQERQHNAKPSVVQCCTTAHTCQRKKGPKRGSTMQKPVSCNNGA